MRRRRSGRRRKRKRRRKWSHHLSRSRPSLSRVVRDQLSRSSPSLSVVVVVVVVRDQLSRPSPSLSLVVRDQLSREVRHHTCGGAITATKCTLHHVTHVVRLVDRQLADFVRNAIFAMHRQRVVSVGGTLKRCGPSTCFTPSQYRNYSSPTPAPVVVIYLINITTDNK